MITKINNIKDFGVFKDFIWNPTISTFKKRNLIYGWNYSGKTTLSALFFNLEKKEKIHFPSSEYTVEIEGNNTTYTQEQLADFPYLVKVFNSFYVKKIFSWDKSNNEVFEPIHFYLGEEAGNVQPKIESLRDRWNPKIQAIKDKNIVITTSFADYAKDSGKFSIQATEIRKYLNEQIKSNEFNKSHFITLVAEVKSDLPKYTLSAERTSEVKGQALATNDFEPLNCEFILNEGLALIGIQVKTLMEDSAPKSIPFPELDDSKNLFNWVQTGLELHKDSTKCKFCDSELKAERIKSLNHYYSDKLKEIQDAVLKIREEIEAEKQCLNIDFLHESKITNHLRENYRKAISDYALQQNKYIDELGIFESDLKRKESNFFNSISATTFKTLSVNTELQKIIDVIKEHNLFVEKFEEKKKNAVSLILRHYVAEYLTAENYIKKENESTIASKTVSRCNSKLNENNNELSRLEALLKNTVKGQEELNNYLKIFLSRDDIQIAIEREMFLLKRGIHPATNLSEGEKTAIAFAYFLTELASLKKEGKLKETIIFFDDPISSLDSNHIFQVRSLIQHFFKDKNEYLQLLISTHNFEFFSILLDSNLFKNGNKKDTNPENCPYYLINRTTSDTSTIANLPKTLRSHKSEYAHIFSILNEYNELENKETFKYKILLPNVLRRFLELYTLFKYPKGFCEVDERIKRVFSPDDGVFHNTKLYHWFSHLNQFEKVAHHDGKIFLIDEAISEVMKHIELNDKLHWQGLTEAG